MTEEKFESLLSRRLQLGRAMINTDLIPGKLKDQIVHMVLMGPYLGPIMGGRFVVEFDFDVNEDDEICRIEWGREDGTRTINLVADGTWFVVYCGAAGTNVLEYVDNTIREADTTTMEAVMLIAGVHPTQL